MGKKTILQPTTKTKAVNSFHSTFFTWYWNYTIIEELRKTYVFAIETFIHEMNKKSQIHKHTHTNKYTENKRKEFVKNTFPEKNWKIRTNNESQVGGLCINDKNQNRTNARFI